MRKKEQEIPSLSDIESIVTQAQICRIGLSDNGIPYIERREEIEEIAALVESGDVLKGEEQKEAEEIVRRLGKRFCRRCGYWQPCPQGVPIQQCMLFDSFVARFSPENLASGPAKGVLEKAPKCIECGVCESKCPYELPIMDMVKEATEKARIAITR
jgi:uncharacterized protein